MTWTDLLATYAPRIYRRMRNNMAKLRRHHPSLRFNFGNSIYPAISFNFGPATVCLEHTDAMNEPCNWCHVTAFGDYDPSVGGHLILFDLRLAVRFPPGSTVMIPSALLRHGNAAIQPHERRMSITQYCAGGLVRWVECGFRTVDGFAREDPEGSLRFTAGLKQRAAQCARLFSTMEELLDGRWMDDW